MVIGQNAMLLVVEESNEEEERPSEGLPMEADLVVGETLKLELVMMNHALVSLN